jgi:hypothetical protein
LHTLELALNAKAGSDEILNTRSVSSTSLYRLHVGHSHMKDSLQVAILLSHLAPHIDNLKWLNERGPRSNTLNMSADGWHKVCEYLPHLQAIRLAEKRMSAVEIVVPPQMSEKSVDATTLSIDTGVQAVVETTECSVQFSPVLVNQAISAIPGVNEASVDARPIFSDMGVLAIPTLLEKSIGTSVVGRAVGSLTNVASKSLESIIEAVALNETSPNQTEPAPKESFPMRVVRAYVYFVTFPIRLFLCSAKPVEDEKVDTEEAPSSNNTSEKSPVASSPTTQQTGDKTTNDVETSEKAVGGEPEATIHLSRAVPVPAF